MSRDLDRTAARHGVTRARVLASLTSAGRALDWREVTRAVAEAGVPENSVRATLSRLVSAGLVVRSRRGSCHVYRLASPAEVSP